MGILFVRPASDPVRLSGGGHSLNRGARLSPQISGLIPFIVAPNKIDAWSVLGWDHAGTVGASPATCVMNDSTPQVWAVFKPRRHAAGTTG